PIVNIVGDHATYHLQHDAPLTSDIEGLARPVSAWVRTTRDAASVGVDAAEAIAAAAAPPGRIATLILPADSAWTEGGKVARAPYPVDPALAVLKDVRRMILVGAGAPVAFFAYPGKPGKLIPETCEVQALAAPEDDLPGALAALAAAVGAKKGEAPRQTLV